jgi:hypothetical protein
MEKDLHPVAHEPKNPGISQEPRQPPTLQSRSGISDPLTPDGPEKLIK